jgi:hypothetical protein
VLCRPAAAIAFRLSVVVFGAALPAQAAMAARPSTLGMTCAEAQATVARNGAVVLTTGEFTYDRFVAHSGFCEPSETADQAIAPTRDNDTCPVGYTCERLQSDQD